MTEEEWIGAVEIESLRRVIQKKNRKAFTERKQRLFAVACARRVLELATSSNARHALDVAEQFADGTSSKADLRKACDAAIRDSNDLDPEEASFDEYRAEWALTAAINAATDRKQQLIYAAECARDASNTADAEQEAQCQLFREIFGNPFRPVTVNPEWLTSDVMFLAQGIYDEKAFDRMPILADAIQDAGCDSDDLLNHLRDTSAAHVRGCWALDLVLGKE